MNPTVLAHLRTLLAKAREQLAEAEQKERLIPATSCTHETRLWAQKRKREAQSVAHSWAAVLLWAEEQGDD